ncbi:hypothetical protein HAP47_0017150 [Bradyrhizobium sp. 41S5]|uniref:hypothetical protein n=1 Tax=Bradyrhizobium sp. 41S5 TaxID=1404443 RepID=UPI00156AB7A5|nr:hypothetical protein [Bradyrhizobium sp. 41S5]UFX48282.1 hypothetical protein HAP47_0017150 [Bradyrhizobium sp. 41S5]
MRETACEAVAYLARKLIKLFLHERLASVPRVTTTTIVRALIAAVDEMGSMSHEAIAFESEFAVAELHDSNVSA